MISRQWADNITMSWPTAGAGGGFRSMSTKAPTSNVSIGSRAAEEQKQVPQKVAKYIDALCRSGLGRSASAAELGELADSFARSGDRRSAVQSVLLMEEALVRLAEPWFWKLLSRTFEVREMAEFVGSVRSGTPFDAAISRVIGSQQYIERAKRRGIGGEGEVNLLQSIHIDLLGRLAESGEVSRALKQIRTVGSSRYALEILRSVEFRRDYLVRLHHELLERTPGEGEMQGWLKRENLGLDLLQIRGHLLAGEEFFNRWTR
jgi:hypothetical protein